MFSLSNIKHEFISNNKNPNDSSVDIDIFKDILISKFKYIKSK